MRILAAIVALAVFLALSATVVDNKPAAAGGQDEIKVFFSADQFDAEGYVAAIWDARVVPHLTERAVNVHTLVDALRADRDGAFKQYGHRDVAEHNPYNFAVSGRVKFLSVNTKSRNGRVEADVEPFDGQADITIQIGPIFRGTSIRDFLDFVTFAEFKNQVEFAKLASQLNFHSRDHVIAPLGLSGGGDEGKIFDLVGAATFDGNSFHLNVVPIALSPVEQ